MAKSLKQRIQSWLNPINELTLKANRRTWQNLPEKLKHGRQVLGVQSPGCAATVGLMEKCDFYCTACYLPKSSNDTPALPFEQVKEQLDMMFETLGPDGNVQLTAGEVTLLPREDLGRIIEYCVSKRLVPMVMTNGQTMLRDPSYLEYLIDKGLTKVAIHVDTTQRGRDGMNPRDSEVDLHWIRDEFANLVRETRRKTGVNLHAAHTFTVTRENQHEVPEVTRWSVQNSDAFRLLSFQPTAEVGRTRVNRQGGNVDELWDYVCRGVGKRLSRDGMTFGHPSCNTVSMNFVVKWKGRTKVVEFLEGEKDSRFFHKLLRKGFGAFTPFDDTKFDLFMKVMRIFAKYPNWAWDLPHYLMYRCHTEIDWLPDFVKTVVTGGAFEINPYAIVVHNFMSADEMLTEEGQDRIRACSFKVPYQGQMISMCEFNGTGMREDNNQSIIQSLEPEPTPTPTPVLV